jgi:heat shock protein HslJ
VPSDLADLLKRTADGPSRPVDAAAVVYKARRQRRRLRSMSALAVVVGAVSVGVIAPSVTGNTNTRVEVVNQYDTDDRGGDVVGDDTASDSELWGRTFTGTHVMHDGEVRALVPNSEIQVTFVAGPPIREVEGGDERLASSAGGQVRWFAGCNSGLSQVTIERARLEVGGYSELTYKLCAGKQGEQDEWLAEFIRSDPEWQLSEGVLTLTSGGTTVTLHDER